MKKEWFTLNGFVKEALPGMPTSKAGYIKWMRKAIKGQPEKSRILPNGNGWEYHYSLLPEPAQAILILKYGDEPTAARDDVQVPAKSKATRKTASWEWYATQPQSIKTRTETRFKALLRVEDLAKKMSRLKAIKIVAAEINVTAQTIYGWFELVFGLHVGDWTPALAPAKRGQGGVRIEVDENFWAAICKVYLRDRGPSLKAAYHIVVRMAKPQGWLVANYKTILRRVHEIPEPVIVLAREGVEALKRLYPCQERDRSMFHALECVNADGHRWDVFVKWEDGTISRPLMMAFQDLYSNMFLAWRIARNESKDVVRLCFGDLIETYGIPEKCWLDNGRGFASKWITGGTQNRYRFKVKPEEPVGILTQLGVEVHWTQPYSGQSKPIERAFKDFADAIAKHPAFDGAYTGHKTDAKPEDYGSKAVPIEVFRAVVDQEIAAHNERAMRETRVCGGKLSFQEAFNASYAQSVIRKASPEQRRMCMLMAESVTARAKDGAIYVLENRYWSEELLEHRGEKLIVRFDPENAHQELAVYTLKNELICEAALIEATGFADTEAAREYNRKRNAFKRAVKDQLAALKTMTLPQEAALMPPVPAYKPPETKVVRLVTAGNTALQPVAEDESETLQFYRDMDRGLRLVTGDSD